MNSSGVDILYTRGLTQRVLSLFAYEESTAAGQWHKIICMQQVIHLSEQATTSVAQALASSTKIAGVDQRYASLEAWLASPVAS